LLLDIAVQLLVVHLFLPHHLPLKHKSKLEKVEIIAMYCQLKPLDEIAFKV